MLDLSLFIVNIYIEMFIEKYDIDGLDQWPCPDWSEKRVCCPLKIYAALQ